MPKLRASFFVLTALPALSGCLSDVATLQPKGQHVAVVRETNRPLHCEVLGKITGTSRSSDEKEARTGAENDFRNHAAELKANFALVEADRVGRVGTGTQHDAFLQGKALFCQTEAMEEADEKAAEAARQRKEKETTEREQKEKDEQKAQAKAKKQPKK